jgi:hypothetical protein
LSADLDICNIMAAYDVSLSIGDGLRGKFTPEFVGWDLRVAVSWIFSAQSL